MASNPPESTENNLSEAMERFCLVLSQVPEGRVCSYGRLAELSGLPHARQACQYLRRLPPGSQLPWYRIVNGQGKLADFSGSSQQRQWLANEGIVFSRTGRIPKSYFI